MLPSWKNVSTEPLETQVSQGTAEKSELIEKTEGSHDEGKILTLAGAKHYSNKEGKIPTLAGEAGTAIPTLRPADIAEEHNVDKEDEIAALRAATTRLKAACPCASWARRRLHRHERSTCPRCRRRVGSLRELAAQLGSRTR